MVDNSTSTVLVYRNGTGWTVDVTPCNLSIDTTVKDFRVVINGAIVPNTNFLKTSPTVITYIGPSVGSTNVPVSVVRATPIERVAELIGYGSRLSTTSYEAELNRLHRLHHEIQERLTNVEIGGSIAGSYIIDEPFGTTWIGDTAQGASRNSLASAINQRVLVSYGTCNNLQTSSVYPDTENSNKLVPANWVRARITNAINTYMNGAPVASTAPLSFGTRIVNQEYLYTVALPAGVILPFAGNNSTPGWLDCNGQEVSRTTYSRLFAAIGTLYGAGDGSTTFNLPNINVQNRVLAGTTSNTNTVAGADTVAVPLPSHSHGVNITSGVESNGHYHNLPSGFDFVFAASTVGAGTFTVSTTAGNLHSGVPLGANNISHTHQVVGSTNAAGVASATMDVRQPTLYIKYRICTGGQ